MASRRKNRFVSATTTASSHPMSGAFALLGIVFLFAWQLAAPLGEFANREDLAIPFARGRLYWEILLQAVVVPDSVAKSWLGGSGWSCLADRLPVLGTAAGILAVAGVLGGRVLSMLGIERDLDRLERAVLAWGIGLHGVSLTVLLAGLAGWLRGARWPGLVAGALILGGGLISSARSRSVKRPGPRAPAGTDDGSFGLPWLGLAIPLLAIILLGGMLPPVDFDVREYHLQAPKEFYQQDRIGFLPHNVYGNMPLGSEMFALLGMVLLDDWWLGALVGKTLSAWYAPLTALGLLAAGRRFAGTTAGVVAALVYLSVPWVIRVSNLGLNEGALAFYLGLAILSYGHWVANRDRRHLLLAGLLAGAAVSIKYTAILFVAIPLWALVAGLDRLGNRLPAPRGGPSWRPAFWFGIAVLISCGPWLVKNAVCTGNPIYPLFHSVLDGGVWTETMAAQWRAAHRPDGYAPARMVSDLVVLGWRSLWQSPLVLPLALLALAHRRLRGMVGPLWIYVIFYLGCWWLFTHRIERFWVPLLPVLAMLAGLGACDATDRMGGKGLQIICVTWILFVTVLATSPQMICGYTRFLADYAWLRDAEERVPAWRIQVEETVPAGTAVLSVGDAEVFDFRVPVYYNTVFDEWLLAAWMGPPPWSDQVARLRTELARRRISRIYIHWGELDRYRRTYDKAWGRSRFVTPGFLANLVEAKLLRPHALAGDGPLPVSLFDVVAIQK